MNVKQLIKDTENKIEKMVANDDVDSAIKQIELLKSLRSIDDNKHVENEPKQGAFGVCVPGIALSLAEMLQKGNKIGVYNPYLNTPLNTPRWNEVNQFPNFPYYQKGINWDTNNGPARLDDKDNYSVIGGFAFNNLC